MGVIVISNRKLCARVFGLPVFYDTYYQTARLGKRMLLLTALFNYDLDNDTITATCEKPSTRPDKKRAFSKENVRFLFIGAQYQI